MFCRLFCASVAVLILSACAAPRPFENQRDVFELPAPAIVPGPRGDNEVVLVALAQIGAPYAYAGSSPDSGFDCSGLVAYAFRSARGIALPRTTYALARQGQTIDAAELQPGDLVFFNTLRREFSHVGIYLGEARFIHAPTSGGRVRIDDLRARYWAERFNGARRSS